MAVAIKNLSLVNLQIRRGAVMVGDVVYGPGGACGPRRQPEFQLVVIHRGSLKLKLDDKTIHVPENHAILLSPRHREHFLFATDQETRHSWCSIEPASVPAAMRKEFRACTGPAPFLGRMATLWETGRTLSSSRIQDEALQSGFYLGLGLAVMSDFAAAVRSGMKIPDTADEALSRMDEFIRHEYAKPLTLDQIARAAGVSRQHLLKLCRLRGRPTAMKQLYLKRLEMSAELLLHTGLAMGEIADRCGFVNVFHFSRKFKQAYGRSPLAWRKGLWKK